MSDTKYWNIQRISGKHSLNVEDTVWVALATADDQHLGMMIHHENGLTLFLTGDEVAEMMDGFLMPRGPIFLKEK